MATTFHAQLDGIERGALLQQIQSMTWREVEHALSCPGPDINRLQALLSPAAVPYLEEMAALSRELTLKRFGKTIQLYVPLYLSDECSNGCVYCGFNKNHSFPRTILDDKQILQEAVALHAQGFGHLLLVTGESPKAGFAYLQNALRIIRPLFSLLSIEVQPLSTGEYHALIQEGLNTVYLYQETYNKTLYARYHPSGKKTDFSYRLDSYERMGQAGIYRIGLGILLGLDDWRTDTVCLAMHLNYLRQKFWRTKYSVSVPRIRPIGTSFNPPSPVSDRDLVQMICALRIFDEYLEISLSTRESPRFRDAAIHLGVTTMSAGSRTSPGGYTCPNTSPGQFDVYDHRSAQEIREMIRNNGYEPVWKDWDVFMQQATL